MKRKLIALLMAICCVAAGLAGCGDDGGNDRSEKSTDKDISLKNIFGGGSEISVVTIEGEKYDLSEDFQKVVRKMAKNGLYPVDIRSYYVYDEDGKYSKKSNSSDFQDSAIRFIVGEMPLVNNIELCSIIYDVYEFGARFDCTFETPDGITQDSDEDDLKELEGYVPYRGIVRSDVKACIALYVDGKIVDLEEYRDEYEAWLKDAKEEGFENAMHERVDGKHIPKFSPIRSVDIETAMEIETYFENDMLLVFAVQEACEKLEAKKIDSFDIVRYAYEPEGMMVEFGHYFYDENWDYNKFRQEEQ